ETSGLGNVRTPRSFGFMILARTCALQEKKRIEPLRCIVGPNGNVLTLADLPSRKTTRWVKRRKTEVVLAVKGGLLSLDEACRRYDLTVEEFASWARAIEKRLL